MSKKPAAALSSNLVAVKGAAMPVPDMPGRASPPPAAVPAKKEAKAGAAAEVGQPLNFRVPAEFRRAFKVYASQHDLKLNELLRLSFEAYRRQQGD
ncbi:MAG: hypothetical protein ACJ8AW_49245 [Rhodopila sp.]|jgi:hypothetical protein